MVRLEALKGKLMDTFTMGNFITIVLVMGSWLIFAIRMDSHVTTNTIGIAENKAAIASKTIERDSLIVLETDVRYIPKAVEKLETGSLR